MRRIVAPKLCSRKNSGCVRASKQWPSTRPNCSQCGKRPRACGPYDWLATPQTRRRRPSTLQRVRRKARPFSVQYLCVVAAYRCDDMLERWRRSFSSTLLSVRRTMLLIEPLSQSDRAGINSCFSDSQTHNPE